MNARFFTRSHIACLTAHAQTPRIEKRGFGTGGAIHSSPAIAADGTIYVADFGANHYVSNKRVHELRDQAAHPGFLVLARSGTAFGLLNADSVAIFDRNGNT